MGGVAVDRAGRMSHMINTITASTVLALALVLSTASVRAQSAAISSVTPPTAVYELEPIAKKPDIKEVQPLVDWPPIWGKEARERGFGLPLPYAPVALVPCPRAPHQQGHPYRKDASSSA